MGMSHPTGRDANLWIFIQQPLDALIPLTSSIGNMKFFFSIFRKQYQHFSKTLLSAAATSSIADRASSM